MAISCMDVNRSCKSRLKNSLFHGRSPVQFICISSPGNTDQHEIDVDCLDLSEIISAGQTIESSVTRFRRHHTRDLLFASPTEFAKWAVSLYLGLRAGKHLFDSGYWKGRLNCPNHRDRGLTEIATKLSVSQFTRLLCWCSGRARTIQHGFLQGGACASQNLCYFKFQILQTRHNVPHQLPCNTPPLTDSPCETYCKVMGGPGSTLDCWKNTIYKQARVRRRTHTVSSLLQCSSKLSLVLFNYAKD